MPFILFSRGQNLTEILFPDVFKTLFEVFREVLEITLAHLCDIGITARNVRCGIVSVDSNRKPKRLDARDRCAVRLDICKNEGILITLFEEVALNDVVIPITLVLYGEIPVLFVPFDLDGRCLSLKLLVVTRI